jgi:hypothetical protein
MGEINELALRHLLGCKLQLLEKKNSNMQCTGNMSTL